MNNLSQQLCKSGLVQQAYRAVEPAYPHEGCGFVFQDGDDLVHVLAKNRAQELHEKDPERFPRGGADWFEPDMRPWIQAEQRGLIPVVIYHSHPDVGAYFSNADYESAVLVLDDGLVLERNPGVCHLVVSVRGGNADGSKLFRFNDETSAFDQIAEYDAQGAAL